MKAAQSLKGWCKAIVRTRLAMPFNALRVSESPLVKMGVLVSSEREREREKERERQRQRQRQRDRERETETERHTGEQPCW